MVKRIAALSVLLTLLLLQGAAFGRGNSGVGHIERAAPMSIGRSVHTATLLMDGTVLIVGGMMREGRILETAERFDPQTNRFIADGNMVNARVEHTATLLEDGLVLIAGGWGRNVLSSAEIYDPVTMSVSNSATQLHCWQMGRFSSQGAVARSNFMTLC